MIGWLAKALDRWTIQMASRSMAAKSTAVAEYVSDAENLLRDLDFLCDFAHAPADWQFSDDSAFRFAYPIETPFVENNVVHGRIVRSGADWSDQPAVILLHGWNGETGYYYQ